MCGNSARSGDTRRRIESPRKGLGINGLWRDEKAGSAIALGSSHAGQHTLWPLDTATSIPHMRPTLHSRRPLFSALVGVCLSSLLAVVTADAQSHARTEPIPMPEPMVFDLVRPLGAKRGELEVNVLMQQSSQSGAPLKWAPEIEWAFRDGLAIEGELPLENGQLMTYKAALQGTLTPRNDGRFQHGWQVIGQRVRADRSWSADALYLAGYRPWRRVTLFTMTGARRSVFDGGPVVQTVQNTSVFYEATPRLILGLETNLVLGAADRRSRLIMPQLQKAISGNYLFEFGVGAEERAAGRWGAAFGARLVRDLH